MKRNQSSENNTDLTQMIKLAKALNKSYYTCIPYSKKVSKNAEIQNRIKEE